MKDKSASRIKPFPVHEVLKKYGIKKIMISGTSCVITRNDGQKEIVFDIGKTSERTLANFTKSARELKLDNKLRGAIKLHFVTEYHKQQEEEQQEGEEGEGEEGGFKKPSVASLMLDILEQEGLINELFRDQYDTPCAVIKSGDHLQTVTMRSRAATQMKNWICYTIYQQLGDLPKDEHVNSILNILRAKATYEGNIRDLYIRVAPGHKQNEILYDLTNKDWEYVRITSDGWTVEKWLPTDTEQRIVFKRYKNQLSQVTPSKDYPSDIFDQFMKLLNIKDDNAKLLLKIYVILLVFPTIQKPILAPCGEQGSAKSTLHEYIKKVIDPSAAITLAFPRDVNELVQKLDHNYVAYFDNISTIRDWISDQFCKP